MGVERETGRQMKRRPTIPKGRRASNADSPHDRVLVKLAQAAGVTPAELNAYQRRVVTTALRGMLQQRAPWS